MTEGKQLLSDIKFYDGYSKYREDKGRKETWAESVKDVMNMHREKFKDLPALVPYLNKAEKAYKNKEVLASQRNLQFRGEQVQAHNARIFNCSSLYIDRIDAFRQTMYLLLCGCGVGISVEKRFIDRIPSIYPREDKTITWQIPDSIEGWATALDKLLRSFFEGSEKIRFDYSLIRPKGAMISGGYKAPGSEPLKKSLELIETILEDKTKEGSYTLTSLDCHDIICISSDAVLAGGIRRSAILSLFDKDDELMLGCKTGDWFYTAPWRARANNSIKLLKGSFTQEEFNNFKETIKQFGEPGIVLVDDLDFCTNPCQPSWATVLTPEGIKTMESVEIGDRIWSSEGWTKITKKWSTGIKEVYAYKTTSGVFYGTKNHRLVSNNVKIEAKDCESIDTLIGEYCEDVILHPEMIMDGLVFGDGGVHKASNNLKLLYIGENDYDYHNSEIKGLINNKREGISPYSWEITTSLSVNDIGIPMYERKIPDKYFRGNKNQVASFLRGLYSANGSVVNNRITLKTSSPFVKEQVQIMLSSLGIVSYYTTNKPKNVKFSNGDYTCRESYDVNISTDREKFVRLIGFIQKYKNEKIIINKTKNSRLENVPIIGTDYISTEEVFDITVDNNSHTYWTGGLNVSNCCEIGFIPVNPSTGNSAINLCNLNEINGGLCDTPEKFYKACRDAAILGTLQASYTDFPFLGKDTEELCRLESLIGISITGIMDNPQVLLNPEVLQRGVEIIKGVNEEVAEIISINPAARLTCIKPSGNASVLLGTSSGIHPAHSKRYFRIMQMNKESEVAKALQEANPRMIEESVWSANNSDYAAYFPIEEAEQVLSKDEMSDIDFLKSVKTVYENWVKPGTISGRGYSDRVTHNVSNTITVQNWDKVFDYIWDNQESFCGLSFMAELGDKVYKQAPFTKVMTFEEIIKVFGEGALFASGLIVDALHAFNGDLWDACEALKNRDFKLEGSRMDVLLKKDIVRRIKKFSKNYMKNNINRTIDCLKNIHIFHKYITVSRELTLLDFDKLNLRPTFVDIDTIGAVACSGGACEIKRI